MVKFPRRKQRRWEKKVILFADSVQGACIQMRRFNERPLEMPTEIKVKEQTKGPQPEVHLTREGRGSGFLMVANWWEITVPRTLFECRPLTLFPGKHKLQPDPTLNAFTTFHDCGNNKAQLKVRKDSFWLEVSEFSVRAPFSLLWHGRLALQGGRGLTYPMEDGRQKEKWS